MLSDVHFSERLIWRPETLLTTFIMKNKTNIHLYYSASLQANNAAAALSLWKKCIGGIFIRCSFNDFFSFNKVKNGYVIFTLHIWFQQIGTMEP